MTGNGPTIDRTARDRDEVLALMLRRMHELVPAWRPESPADLGLTILELLASEADRLAYAQDAAATEAYLGTARYRRSMVRHARLIGVADQQGCNARTWVQVRVREGATVHLPAGLGLFTGIGDAPGRIDPEAAVPLAEREHPVGFETMERASLRAEHLRMHLHAGAADDDELAAGATTATLCGHFPHLAAGDAIGFGAHTLDNSRADVVVRLARTPILHHDHESGHPITHLEWHADDALPGPVRIGQRSPAGSCRHTSAALGNLVLADHGLTQVATIESVHTPLGERWLLRADDITVAEREPAGGWRGQPAARASERDPARSLASIRLLDLGHAVPAEWFPTRDLLGCHRFARSFVVELGDDGRAWLRFGDGRHGRRPAADAAFAATMRVGSGAAGNVGAGAIAHIVVDDEAVLDATNVTPARGGQPAEPAAQLRVRAPRSWQRLEACVTPADYAERALDVAGVTATFARWGTITGATPVELFVDIDPLHDTDAVVGAVRQLLERRRPIGHELHVVLAETIEILVSARVLVEPDADRTHVALELRRALGAEPGGALAPGRYTMGQPVFASTLVAAAASVPGVVAVQLMRFAATGDTGDTARAVVDVPECAVAQLSNDHRALEIELVVES